MTTSFTDDEILEGIKWSSDDAMCPAEFSERMAWTLARLMVERDQARLERDVIKAECDEWRRVMLTRKRDE